jgi:aspartyl-tRNA synthetase
MHGITQLLFLETNKNSYLFAKTATNESVIQVEGEVLLRKTKNTLLKTGEIEVLVQKAKQLNQFAEGFPIDINNIEEILSEKHLKFRHLFLRNPQVKANLIFKHQVIKFLHQFFLKNNFIEIETPVLSRSYPEGAREFKVFSEAEKEAKYTLAQSPQIFKQLLMVGGFERYYQIAKCFRDETLRSDRQPEFLQLDFEMNFVSEKEIFHLVKKLLSFL